MIEIIGYQVKSDEQRLNLIAMIFCLASDMLLLPFLIGVSLVELNKDSILSHALQGKHTDFGSGWYQDVG